MPPAWTEGDEPTESERSGAGAEANVATTDNSDWARNGPEYKRLFENCCG